MFSLTGTQSSVFVCLFVCFCLYVLKCPLSLTRGSFVFLDFSSVGHLSRFCLRGWKYLLFVLDTIIRDFFSSVFVHTFCWTWTHSHQNRLRVWLFLLLDTDTFIRILLVWMGISSVCLRQNYPGFVCMGGYIFYLTSTPLTSRHSLTDRWAQPINARLQTHLLK